MIGDMVWPVPAQQSLYVLYGQTFFSGPAHSSKDDVKLPPMICFLVLIEAFSSYL
jgi:hypothetical protein